VGEWVSGRVVEWVRDTKRSQTQSVSPRKPPPLAGHTLPVDQKDRGREGESGRGTQRESHTQCVSPRGEEEWQRDTKRCRTQCVTTTGPMERVGEKGRVGEVERDTKRKPYSVCVSR